MIHILKLYVIIFYTGGFGMTNNKNFIYHYTSNDDGSDYILEVPCYKIIKKINGNDFRKIFVVDIRNLKHCEEIFKNFDNFQNVYKNTRKLLGNP